jgi:hypothetical protein
VDAKAARSRRRVEQPFLTAPAEERRQALRQEREAPIIQRRDQGRCDLRVEAALFGSTAAANRGWV